MYENTMREANAAETKLFIMFKTSLVGRKYAILFPLINMRVYFLIYNFCNGNLFCRTFSSVCVCVCVAMCVPIDH